MVFDLSRGFRDTSGNLWSQCNHVETIATTSEKEKPIVMAEKPSFPSGTKSVADDSIAPVSTMPKKSLWVCFKDESNHYKSGFKLLFLDTKVSSKSPAK